VADWLGGIRFVVRSVVVTCDELVVANLVLAPGLTLSQLLEDFLVLLLQTDKLFRVAPHVAAGR
jgi:hypothetical protein